MNNSKGYLTLYFLVLLHVLMFSGAVLSEQDTAVGRFYLESFVRNADIILHARIVAMDSMKLLEERVVKNLSGPDAKYATMKMCVSEFTLYIYEVLKGEYNGDTLQLIWKVGNCRGSFSFFYLSEFIDIPNVQDEVIVGIWKNSYDIYVLDGMNDIFKKNDRTLIPYIKNTYFVMDNPLDVIEDLVIR